MERLRGGGLPHARLPDRSRPGLSLSANEHAKPDLEAVRARLLARAAEAGLQGAEDDVIEELLEREVPDAEPSEKECRRFYEANTRRFTAGELVEASHILFAVTPRVPPGRLRAKAAEVHALASRSPERFAELAREYSNCPSAAQGGSLGQLARGDAVPCSRVVARRIPGRVVPYEEAKEEVAAVLRRLGEKRALGEYVRRSTPQTGAD